MNMPPYHSPQQQPVIVPPRRPKRRVRFRFRWKWVLIPAAVLILAYLAGGIEVGFTFDDIMDVLKVKDRTRYRQLVTLGLVVTAIVAVLRVLRDDKRKKTE